MADLSGRTIKGYELRECIGQGSFGAVYRAHQPAVNRDVAVKVILAQHADQPDFIRRFESEAQVVARLEHPHIVPLYDYWREPGGAYLVMRWLPGNLQRALAQGPWPLDAIGRLLEQMAGALHAAHRGGIVHRDVKPANMLLDEDRNAYLADFGVAKILDLTAQPTGDGSLISSPAYSAPEQIRGEHVTPQTDLYSLGLVLYELLTGIPPFLEATTPTALIYKHLNEALPSVRQARPELPLALDVVVQTATAKDPAARYPDALRMAGALSALIEAPQHRATQPLAGQLTERELEILRLMVADLDNNQIAERLVLTIGTVRWYVKQIFGKLDVHSRAQAIERARELRPTDARLSASLVQAAGKRPKMSEPAKNVVSPTISIAQLENPYKGLRAFREVDAPDFFGREALIQQLLDRLAEDHPLARFLAVVGPSGSGKSSVVRAGLIPALRAGRLSGSERWFITDMLPGTHPFEEIEAALNRIAARSGASLLGLLREDERGLARAVKQTLPSEGGEVLLVIDQFEETFTLLDDEAERTSFLDSIEAAVTDPRGHVRVVLTLRADFYDRPLLYGAFAELMRQRTEVIVPLNDAELRLAVTGPAQRVSLAVEPALIQAMVDEVSAQPGALPLFQYALTEAFEQRQEHTLTLEAYQAIGGLTGALARRTEHVYAALSEAEQGMARQLFLRLVTLGEGVEDTRRRVAHSELLALGDAEAMQSAIDAFDRARLLSFDRDPLTRGATVEVAHEAILREWGRLRGWLDESRADVRTQRLLAGAATEWTGGARDPSYLLYGARLAQVSAWAQNTDVALTADERDYLAASVRAERRAVTLRRRVRRAVAGISLVVAVVMTLLAVLATSRERQALREAAVNHSLVLANDAQQAFENGRTDLGLALALEAIAIDQPPARAIQALRTVAQGMGTRVILRSEGNAVKAVAFSPDSRLALSGSCETLDDSTCNKGELIVWDLVTGTERRRLEGHTGWITSLAFNPARSEIALSASEDGTLILWNVETGEIIRRFEGHTGGVSSVAFSADGSLALSGSDDQVAILWDGATGRIVRRFTEHRVPVTAVALSPDQRWAATGAGIADSHILLWDVASGAVVHRLVGPAARILAIGFRVDEQGQMLLHAISADNVYREWDTGSGALARLPVTVTGTLLGFRTLPDQRSALECEGNICGLIAINTWRVTDQFIAPSQRLIASSAVSADGQLALFGSVAGEVILANLPLTAEIGRYQTQRGLATVDISPDGRYLLTGEYDSGTAILWDVQTGQEIRRVQGLASVVASVEFSPDGQQALICSNEAFMGTPEGKAILWEIETGRVLHEWDDFEYYPRTSAFSPDGQSVLIGTLQWGSAWAEEGVSGELIQFDVRTGRKIREYGPTSTILDISFSPDGRRAITGNSVYGYATLWDTATGKPIRLFEHYALAVASTADPRYFLVGSEGGLVFLVDAETGADVRWFSGPSSTFWSLATDPNQDYLLGGGGHQNLLVLWDFETGREVQRFQGHGSATNVWNVVFSPDGHTAFSSALGADEDVIQWRIADIPLDELLAWVRANRYVRDFTCEERAQYDIPPLCETDAP